jgi:hypothetical protein
MLFTTKEGIELMMHRPATYKLTIKTKRFLRKTKVETFRGAWSCVWEVQYMVAKYRPKTEILSIESISEIKEATK